MNDQLSKELAKVNEEIANVEKVRGIFSDEEIEAKLAPLRQRRAALLAQLPAAPQGGGSVSLGGGKVGGSVITGTVSAGGDFAGRDKKTITYGSGGIDEAGRAELKRLLQELQQALDQVPPQKQEEAVAVATLATELVEKAQAEKPNKPAIQISGEGLKKAAENLAAITPTVLTIAGQIVTAISRYLPV